MLLRVFYADTSCVPPVDSLRTVEVQFLTSAPTYRYPSIKYADSRLMCEIRATVDKT